MAQRRQVGVVAEAVGAQIPGAHSPGGVGCEDRADVDPHVEQGEGRVPEVTVLRVVVRLPDESLEVALEQPVAERDGEQPDQGEW